jgi:hypothetical protein
MASQKSANNLQQIRIKRYLAKDYDAFKAYSIDRASLYYENAVKDFSDPGFGGLITDLQATIGDNLSFYLDHQFGELDPTTAVESTNIQRHIINSGIKICGASPATVNLTLYVVIPSAVVNNLNVPDPNALPICRSGSIFSSNSGVNFMLIDDADFTKTNADGTLIAQRKIATQASDGTVTSYVLSLSDCIAVSGKEVTDTFTVNGFTPFKKITLSNANVSSILSVSDGYGNTYYEVSNLTDDVVYSAVDNTQSDNTVVQSVLKIVPAPYRFITRVDLNNRTTTLTFGGGQDNSTDTGVLADPSEFALPLPFNKTFSTTALNPNMLLNTTTLGIAAVDTTYSITYFCGGGLSHNVSPNSINSKKSINIFFPKNPSASVAARVKNSLEVTNLSYASGGEDAPTSDELVAMIPASKNLQERIVTSQDLLVRVHSMPSNFGRVFRAAVRQNPNNPLAAMLFIVSRDNNNKLIISPDTLKKNISTYVNEYRLINDALDILDSPITNITFTFQVVVSASMNKNTVVQNILSNLQSYFNVTKFYIDQPISLDDVKNQLLVQGVVSVDNMQFKSVTGNIDNRSYSDVMFDPTSNTSRGLLYPPPGGIFEVKYTEYDIIGRAI